MLCIPILIPYIYLSYTCIERYISPGPAISLSEKPHSHMDPEQYRSDYNEAPDQKGLGEHFLPQAQHMTGWSQKIVQGVGCPAHGQFSKIVGEQTVAEPLLSQGSQPGPRRFVSLQRRGGPMFLK